MTTGVFDHEDRARQLLRFDGMHIEKRGFTDFDAVMEWRNKGWLVFEAKLMGKDVPLGQRITLERFVLNASAVGKYAVAAVVEHDVIDTRKPVYLRECIVRSVFVTGEYAWRPTKYVMNAHQLMKSFINVAERYGRG